MSKGKRKAKARAEYDGGDDALLARVLREQDWAYAHWLERHSFDQIRRYANRSVDEGGLGYDLSQSALKGLVHGARERRGDLSMSRDERIERQQAELDEVMRALRADIANAAKLETVSVHSTKLLLDAQKAERELHGLAAPVEASIVVTHRDAVLDELNEVMLRAGLEPVNPRKEKASTE